jgi:predicted nucleic acid-binding protein
MPPVLLDTNVLVNAAYEEAPLHGPALRLLDQALSAAGRYCITPQNMVEFASVVSKKRHVYAPMPAEDIAAFVSLLYRSRILKKIYPKRATVMRAIREGSQLGITHTTWYDMYLAQTMRDAGISMIVTEDRKDFEKIPFITALSIDEAAQQLGDEA